MHIVLQLNLLSELLLLKVTDIWLIGLLRGMCVTATSSLTVSAKTSEKARKWKWTHRIGLHGPKILHKECLPKSTSLFMWLVATDKRLAFTENSMCLNNGKWELLHNSYTLLMCCLLFMCMESCLSISVPWSLCTFGAIGPRHSKHLEEDTVAHHTDMVTVMHFSLSPSCQSDLAVFPSDACRR